MSHRTSSRARGRAAALLVVVIVQALAVLALTPAWAHEGPGHGVSDAEHAREDLAGESITRIERDTAAQARRLEANGTQPRLTAAATAAATGTDVPTDPTLSGRWSGVVKTQVVPVFQAVLPSGKVLMWDSVGDTGGQGGDPNVDQTYTRAMVWNPTDNTFTRVDVQDANIFCAGYTQLANGNVLVVGGNRNTANGGIRQTHLFNWRSETWSRGPDMPWERWYPSVAALGNGEAVIVGGGPSQAEVFQTDGTLRPLTGFVSYAYRLYSFLVPRGDGRVEVVGPDSTYDTMNTAGAGTLDARTPAPDGMVRDYGGFATYAPDKTLVTGGGRAAEDGQLVAMRTTEVVDTSGSGTTVRAAAPMNFPRRQHNTTILPDDTVLVTGGMRSGALLVDLANPVQAAELWNPASDTWTTLASASRIREYHSSASLLPDGRVLTGGGGVCGDCVATGYLEKNIEYFSPPYLFARNSSVVPAVRPTLGHVPDAISLGRSFNLTWGAADDITRLSLIRLGAPTHSIDQGQRYVPLSFTANPTTKTLRVKAPTDRELALPGYYLLTAVDGAGTPSVSSIVRVLPGTNLVSARHVSASSAASRQERARAGGDGLLGTRWASAAQTGQWWQADLGEVRTIDSASVDWDQRVPASFAVQVSTTGTTWSTVSTGSGTPLTGQQVSFAPTTARYIRLLDTSSASGGAAGMTVDEVQVYGDQ